VTERRRVLVSAYACDPFRGSEEGVGWGWVRAIALHHEVDVITAAFHRPAIERWQAAHPSDGASVHFHYVAPRWFHYRPTRGWLWIESSLCKPLMNLAYAQWLRDAARLAATLDGERDFDLMHLVTYVGYRFPGRYDTLGKPFVWGPLGGLENTPWRFLPSLGVAGCAYYAARNVVNALQRRLLPSPRRALRAAGPGVIAATEGIRRALHRTYGVESEVISEIGLAAGGHAAPTERRDGEPLRIIWSGEHLPGKALPLLLRALPGLASSLDWHLTVLGAGRRTRAWQRIARRAGVGQRITWTGWLPRDEALEQMAAAHVLVITSLKDLTSTVLLEALGCGLPVICPDHCGFSNVVDETCGIKVAVTNPRRLSTDLTTALQRLAGDEEERRRLAAGALVRARAATWDGKAARIEAVYARVLRARATAEPKIAASPAGARGVVSGW